SGAKIGFANNGVTYITTDANGQAKYSTKNLDIGTYNFIVRFFGDNTYAASDKLNVKVVVRSS
ncbi:Ig-like domain-containing protein, partial [Methanobrevibacter sp.]|uniref:Ig-like domain-containing protein n=1 Tax=Methanobrevibacter sp. TaxID=66852 RepID=UPI0038673234